MAATATPVSIEELVLTSDQLWVRTGFPTKVTNVSTSKKFVRKLFAVAMSNVCFLRTNFHDDAFTVLQLDRWTPIRLLRKNSTSPSADLAIKNIEGAMDAFKRGYLARVKVVITENEESDDDPLEVYTFDFGNSDIGEYYRTYVNGTETEGLSVASMVKALASKDAQEAFKRATKRTLRELSVAVEGLDSLPDKAFMSFHLMYTPDTPTNYEAPGYEPTSIVIKFPQAPREIKVAQITTGFHKVQTKVESRPSRSPTQLPSRKVEEGSELTAEGMAQGLDYEEDNFQENQVALDRVNKLSRKRPKSVRKNDEENKSKSKKMDI